MNSYFRSDITHLDYSSKHYPFNQSIDLLFDGVSTTTSLLGDMKSIPPPPNNCSDTAAFDQWLPFHSDSTAGSLFSSGIDPKVRHCVAERQSISLNERARDNNIVGEITTCHVPLADVMTVADVPLEVEFMLPTAMHVRLATHEMPEKEWPLSRSWKSHLEHSRDFNELRSKRPTMCRPRHTPSTWSKRGAAGVDPLNRLGAAPDGSVPSIEDRGKILGLRIAG